MQRREFLGAGGRALLGASGVAVALQEIACGGQGAGGPVPTPIPSPTPALFPLTVNLKPGVAGGSAIEGGAITIGAQTLPITGGGIVFASVLRGDTVHVLAEGGYLERDTAIRSDDPGLTLELWPLIDGLDMTFMRQIIYNELELPGGEPLCRPRVGTYVVPDATIAGDHQAMRSLQAATEMLSVAGNIPFVVTRNPPVGVGAVIASVAVDPDKVPHPEDNDVYTTTRFDSDWYIISSEICARNLEVVRAYPALLAHELGHARGLCHVEEKDALMNHVVRAPRFLPKELVCIRMADLRLAGQVALDDDSAVIVSSGREAPLPEAERKVAHVRVFENCRPG